MPIAALWRCLISARRDVRGGTAVIFGLAFPIIAVLAAGAVDLASVNSDRAAMQDTADATALAMAKQLGIATVPGIIARSQVFAAQELGAVGRRDAATTTTTVASDNSSVTVAISGRRSSFFGNLLPPGGWSMNVQATAATLGQLPLCVLSSGTDTASLVSMADTAQMSAPKCLVQSNTNLTVSGSATLQAGLAQAAGTATGSISPTPQAGAPTISDPFSSMTFNPPSLLGLCDLLDLTYDLGVTQLTPGTHCGNITVKSGATVNLSPGEYYFKNGQLKIQDNGVLTGSNVVLVFDKTSSFSFTDSSSITLSGMKTGQYAGFVIATTRDNTSTFNISSTSARQLEGTIYIPSATLAVSGASNTVADQSAWTVVVAKAIQMSGSPNLVINANYSASQVPVPAGVGSKYANGKAMLEK